MSLRVLQLLLLLLTLVVVAVLVAQVALLVLLAEDVLQDLETYIGGAGNCKPPSSAPALVRSEAARAAGYGGLATASASSSPSATTLRI